MFPDHGMAEKAIEFATPTIAAILAANNCDDMHAIVGLREPDGSEWRTLASKSFGKTEPWGLAGSYDDIALQMFCLSARTGLDTRVVQLAKPWLRRPGNTEFWGSVVLDNIVAAAHSDLEPRLNEACAGIVAVTLRGLVG